MLLHKGKHPFVSRSSRSRKELEVAIEATDIRAKIDGSYSDLCKDFLCRILAKSYFERYSVFEALQHPWITRKLEDEIPMKMHEAIRAIEIRNSLKRVFKGIGFLEFLKENRRIELEKLEAAKAVADVVETESEEKTVDETEDTRMTVETQETPNLTQRSLNMKKKRMLKNTQNQRKFQLYYYKNPIITKQNRFKSFTSASKKNQQCTSLNSNSKIAELTQDNIRTKELCNHRSRISVTNFETEKFKKKSTIKLPRDNKENNHFVSERRRKARKQFTAEFRVRTNSRTKKGNSGKQNKTKISSISNFDDFVKLMKKRPLYESNRANKQKMNLLKQWSKTAKRNMDKCLQRDFKIACTLEHDREKSKRKLEEKIENISYAGSNIRKYLVAKKGSKEDLKVNMRASAKINSNSLEPLKRRRSRGTLKIKRKTSTQVNGIRRSLHTKKLSNISDNQYNPDLTSLINKYDNIKKEGNSISIMMTNFEIQKQKNTGKVSKILKNRGRPLMNIDLSEINMLANRGQNVLRRGKLSRKRSNFV